MNYEEFSEYIENDPVFYFDTNCLLELYNLSQEKINILIATFEDYDINIEFKIPDTVMKEYKKNINKIEYRSHKYLTGDLLAIKDILKESKNKLKKLDILNNEKIMYDELVDKILELENYIENKYYSKDKVDIPKVVSTNELIDLLISKSVLMTEIDTRTKIEWMTEGYVRMKYNFPPGYEDFSKYKYDIEQARKKKTHPTPDKLDRHLGDYYIWKEILADNTDKSKVFVTNDLKKDWWEVPKETHSLVDYKPRNELISEFESVASNEGIEMDFIPFNLFLNFLITYYNEDLNRELISSFIVENYQNYIEDVILYKISGASINEISTLEEDIMSDYDFNKGLKVQNWDINVHHTELDFIDYDYDYEEVESEGSENIYRIVLNIIVKLEGEFSFGLGLENDVFEHSNGEFKVETLEIASKLTVRAPLITDKNKVQSGKIFEDMDLTELEFEYVSISAPILVRDYQLEREHQLELEYQLERENKLEREYQLKRNDE